MPEQSPSSPSPGLAAGAIDPVFAAIKRYLELEAEASEEGLSDSERNRRLNLAERAREQLGDAKPTTLPGACALLAHLAVSDGHDENEPMLRAVQTVRRVIAALPTSPDLAAAAIDPVFAAIARHKALAADAEKGDLSDREQERRLDLADLAREQLADVTPTTWRGACALLAHLAAFEGWGEDVLLRAGRTAARMVAAP